jgi:predicted MPP superfamily phosphohydrolase
MANEIDRRDFLKLTAISGLGVVFASALPGMARAAGQDDFYFVQLSDTHWGFEGPPNPDAKGTLKKAVAAVNSLEREPDFIMFTGDLTHTTDNPVERRKRMAEFQEIVKDLKAKTVRFMPGEHDASLDNGKAFQEFFGATHYTFDHKGVHFIVLDNVSDPRAARVAHRRPRAAEAGRTDRGVHASAAF